MKISVSLFLALSLTAAPLLADQLILAQLTHSTISDDESSINFDMNGMDFRYMNFGNQGLYFGFGLGGASGEDELCNDDFCIDFDIKSNAATFEVGYNFRNPFTPFVSLVRANSEVDFGITGIGITDTSESDTSVGVGTWFGGDDRRIRLEIHDVDADDPGISLGGYSVLDNDFVLTGFLSTTTEDPGNSWGLSIGLGWSF